MIQERKDRWLKAGQRMHDYYQARRMEGNISISDWAEMQQYREALRHERNGLARPMYTKEQWIEFYVNQENSEDKEMVRKTLNETIPALEATGLSPEEIEQALQTTNFPSELINLFLIEQGVIRYKD